MYSCFSRDRDILTHKSLVFTQRLTCRGIERVRHVERRNTDFIDKPRNTAISCWSINAPVRSPHWVFNSLHVISKAFRALHARVIRAKPRGERIYEESRDQADSTHKHVYERPAIKYNCCLLRLFPTREINASQEERKASVSLTFAARLCQRNRISP